MNRPVRLLLLFPHYNNLQQRGSLRSSQVGMFFAEKGYEVVVFAPGVDLRTGVAFPELEGKLYSDNMIDGVRVIRPKSLQHFRKSFIRRLVYEIIYAFSSILLMFRIDRPDIIIAAYPPAVLPGIGLLVSKLRRIPFIFEVRDLMADAIVSNRYSKSRLFNVIARTVENRIYRHADSIVTVSDGIKKKIVEKGVSPHKITPVKNGYEPQVFSTADYSFDARREYGWLDKFVVIYAGGLTQSYDIPTLLRTAKLMRDEHDVIFAIIGEGDRKEEYEFECRENKLENVNILPSVPRYMMPAILSAANVGVHLFPDDPLWSYVLGNKPFDYLGSGIPMVYAGTGDTADLVLDAEAGFVVHPERPKELAQKLQWLRDNPKEARRMGEKGRQYVRANFNRFKLLEQFDRIVREIAKI